MRRTLDLLLDPYTEERATVEVNAVNNQSWHNMMKKSIEALGRAKPNFGTDFDCYSISCYNNFFKVVVFLENGTELHIEYPWYELFTVETIKEFSEKGGVIPDDLSKEQEFEAEKVLIRKIWNFYRS